jgi:hypothetical protein
MANVNIAQLRTILQQAHPNRVVLIHASVLLNILNSYKAASGGNEVAVSTVAQSSQTSHGPLDLTAY